MTLPHVYQTRGKTWTRDYKPERKQKRSFAEKFRNSLQTIAAFLTLFAIGLCFAYLLVMGIDEEAKREVRYEIRVD